MKAQRFVLIVAAMLAGLALAVQAAPAGRHYGGGHYGGGHHYGGGGGYYGHGARVGIYYGGGPYWWGGGWGGWWGAPYYGVGWGAVAPAYVYGPPAVVNSTEGVVYVERDQAGVATQRAVPQTAPAPAVAADAAPAPPPVGQWWYLCASPRGAYPYVRECPGGWERVPAIPPGQVK